MVSNSNMYNPDEALHELQLQEHIFNSKVDTQVILQVLIRNGLTTREEVQELRDKVIINNPEYKATRDSIEQQKKGFKEAKSNPEGYLKSLLKAKMEGKIK